MSAETIELVGTPDIKTQLSRRDIENLCNNLHTKEKGRLLSVARETITRTIDWKDGWSSRSACQDMIDEGVFDLPRKKSRSSYEADLALAICGICPVREECLQKALDDKDFDGIRGGTTGRERARIVKQQDVPAA